MNSTRRIALIVALLATFSLTGTQSVLAQTKVAIVDIGLVFKSHPRFKQQLESLKTQADQFKTTSIAAQQDLVQQAQGLRSYNPGSPEYNALESKLAQQSAAMELDQKNRMRQLMEQEAKLHYDTYQEINAAVAKFCEANDIRLVLRFNGDSMDPNQPASVMQRVNSSVVFHIPQTDITRFIVTELGGQIATANAGALDQR